MKAIIFMFGILIGLFIEITNSNGHDRSYGFLSAIALFTLIILLYMDREDS